MAVPVEFVEAANSSGLRLSTTLADVVAWRATISAFV